MKSLKDVKLQDKKILLRLDLNLPILEGKIIDTNRITRALPTIKYLLSQGAKVIIISHFGRPEGKQNEEFSLKKVLPELKDALGSQEVLFCDECIGKTAEEMVNSLQAEQVLLLENLRFHPEEEKNEQGFSQALAKLADIYVNDAFSCSHREHASISGITKLLPSYPGLLMQEELINLALVVNNEKDSVIAIVGGKKVSTKFKVLKYLASRANTLVVAGAMANTFLKIQNVKLGGSYYEPDFVEQAREFMNTKHKAHIFIPSDFAVLNKATNDVRICAINECNEGEIIYDIGITSAEQICRVIKEAKILLWNGPLGFYEDERFAVATMQVARFIAHRTQKGLLKSIIGGGDIVAAVDKAGLINSMSYVSTGGGALLEYLEQGTLPGIEALHH